jgi:hypothetical protein
MMNSEVREQFTSDIKEGMRCSLETSKKDEG